ncbi:hypothetical protein QBC34DRAFT_349230 [Podospora aff. communis PSN243]|uniref:Hypersensitive response-inducing protein n=1 Tax=Podospora aff. communis PSN243 TaxID=3040156 RepID=A0AAV9GV80_9PEZI|nr:hypothetical protein QBC34DRAFT_349230 [Podospora aff. communis PSN243]
MKFSILALAATAAAATIQLDQRQYHPFEVRNFTASCVPHSAMCFYTLNAFMPGTMDTQGYDCSASGIGGPGTLPEIQGGTCLPSSRTFDVRRTEGGMNLIVSVQVSRLSYTRGIHFIPDEQIQVVSGVTPTGDYVKYVGPKDFMTEYYWE